MKHVYTLADLRNWREATRDISPRILLGVLGDPIAHSLSPQFMNAALQHEQLPHAYARFAIKPDELREALELTRSHDFIGLNVTVPHKVTALAAMDYLEESASTIGAVNTVAFRHGKLRGSNSDAVGFAKAVREEFGFDVRALRVVVLGGGGAARAIASTCREPRIWKRSEQTLEEFRPHFREADLIVNATPVGLQASDEPLLRRQDFRTGQLLFDTIYRPAETRLMIEGKSAGARVANGLSMLLHQGAASFETWFNKPAPLEAMRSALRQFA